MRKVLSFPAMLIVFLAALVWLLSSGDASDPDIWWHLRNAEYLLQSHGVPNHDMYSFTVAGVNWINHEWLAEIPYYLAWRAGGLAGIWFLWVLTVQAIFALVLYLCFQSSQNIKASVLACAACSFAAVVSFGPRTILFGYLYLALLLILLERFRSRGKSLWFVPPLFCLWINTHGSWLFGFALFGIAGAAGFADGKWGRIESTHWTGKQARHLVTVAALSVAALFINPYGWRLIAYPFEFATKQPLNVANIVEWASVNFHEPQGMAVLFLLAALFAGALFSSRTWQLTDVAFLIAGLYLGLSYVRFLILLSIVAAPILAKLLDFIPPYEAGIDKPVLNAIFMAGALLFIVAFAPPPNAAALRDDTNRHFPAGILPYLQAHPPNGNVLNDYGWGGYLIWHARDVKVFIDSRVDIFEYAGVFGDYADLRGLKNTDELFAKYRIRYALIPATEPLAYMLEHDRTWKVNYRDKSCVLFEKTA